MKTSAVHSAISALLLILISAEAQAVKLSEILEDSLFGDVYAIAVLGDEPLVLDQDIVLGGRSLTLTAARIEIPQDISISSFDEDALVASSLETTKPEKAARGAPHNGRGHNSHGGPGAKGRQGATGAEGLSSGNVKIITSSKPTGGGKLTVNLFGQNGGPGQAGGDGGDGYPGGGAHDGSSTAIRCRRQPGDGGNGGNGGPGGDGGLGGRGGDGGIFIYVALFGDALVKGNMEGGVGGQGGAAGVGGAGAAPGGKGSRTGHCQRNASNGSPGQNGSNGNAGLEGSKGKKGEFIVL